jgi:hypothetical protein
VNGVKGAASFCFVLVSVTRSPSRLRVISVSRLAGMFVDPRDRSSFQPV